MANWGMASPNWAPETEGLVNEGEVIVTITPRTGRGHAFIPDNVVTAALQRHGEIVMGRRCAWPEYPSIENGRRQFVMKVNNPIGSSLRFGVASFSVTHKGQARTCFKCGKEGHEVRECRVEFCYRCREEGHKLSKCTGERQCVSCGKKGHIYTLCPNSSANKVLLGKEWEKVVREEIADEETLKTEQVGENSRQVTTGSSKSIEGEKGREESDGVPCQIKEVDGRISPAASWS